MVDLGIITNVCIPTCLYRHMYVSIHQDTPGHKLCSLQLSNTTFPPKHSSTCPQPVLYPRTRGNYVFPGGYRKSSLPPAQGAARGSQHHWEPQAVPSESSSCSLNFQCHQILLEQSLVIHMILTQACNNSQFKRRMNDFMSRSSQTNTQEI